MGVNVNMEKFTTEYLVSLVLLSVYELLSLLSFRSFNELYTPRLVDL